MPTINGTFAAAYIASDAQVASIGGDAAVFAQLEGRADTAITDRGWTRIGPWNEKTIRVFVTAQGMEIYAYSEYSDPANSSRYRIVAPCQRTVP